VAVLQGSRLQLLFPFESTRFIVWTRWQDISQPIISLTLHVGSQFSMNPSTKTKALSASMQSSNPLLIFLILWATRFSLVLLSFHGPRTPAITVRFQH
jgi:hypothetical protein